MRNTQPTRGLSTLRYDLRPGDIGSIVRLHGVVSAREHGWDPTFEAYVAAPLAEFVLRASRCERIWIAERDDEIHGCVAIVAATPGVAQIRWFLVDPSARGAGLGKKLLNEAIFFARECSYSEIFLWTEASLEAAAHLYRGAGFRKTEEKPAKIWGTDVVEEKYELRLMRA